MRVLHQGAKAKVAQSGKAHEVGNLFTIPPWMPFAESLAQGVLKRYPDPLDLSEVTIFLPSRRARRTLQQAFLQAGEGKPLLLPSMLALGDIDEEDLIFSPAGISHQNGTAQSAVSTIPPLSIIPPAVAPLTRKLLLSRLVAQKLAQHTSRENQGEILDKAARLADELASFLDEVESEDLDFSKLVGLVPDDFAKHWQETLDFLTILTDHWPAILHDRNLLDQSTRRRRMLATQAQVWSLCPPAHPVIAAGIQLSDPASAGLLRAILSLPRGEVILPGLDTHYCSKEEALWELIAQDPAHPYFAMARLLKTLNISVNAVTNWPEVAEPAQQDRPEKIRSSMVIRALTPASAIDSWQRGASALGSDAVTRALQGVKRIDCASLGEEAQVIALLMRKVLETPEKTAALVTPDRALARRVATELRRWDINVDDSAGLAFAATPPGIFLQLLAEAMEQSLAPVALLALLKHPLAAGGEDPADFRRKVRFFERHVLRGPRPHPGIEGLRQLFQTSREAAQAKAHNASAGYHQHLWNEMDHWLARLLERFVPFQQVYKNQAGLKAFFIQHIRTAERLCETLEDEGAERLWAGDAGEMAGGFVSDFLEALESYGDDLPITVYAQLFASFSRNYTLRPSYGRHPRLAILGTLEARLYQGDVFILGGMNEGSWPKEPTPGAWMSRPMRKQFGLPPLERKIGLAAHDFLNAVNAKEVFITRAVRSQGSPTVPSRWLLRLDAYLASLGIETTQLQDTSAFWRKLAGEIDQPARIVPGQRPAPKPPATARPTSYSVTQIATLQKDPYAFYARNILRLFKLDALDSEVDAADKGTIIHEALERFTKAWPKDLTGDAHTQLLEHAAAAFEPLKSRPALYALWWPRFERAAGWIIKAEQRRRQSRPHIFSEVKGRLLWGDFTLTAKADRIERYSDGSFGILDYKTGKVPDFAYTKKNFHPQLLLEAIMATNGAFDGLPAGLVREVAYWRISGGDPAGEEISLGDQEVIKAMELAQEGILSLLHHFADRDAAYTANPRPDNALEYNDYDHLARLEEWSVVKGGDT